MSEKLKIGLLYIGLHNQLKKKYGVNCIFSRKELFCKLGKHSQLPKPLRYYIIEEMCKKNLMEKINRDEVKLLPFEVDMETEPNKLYSFLDLIVID
jgi:hypothetical protein